jgi:NTE family protein
VLACFFAPIERNKKHVLNQPENSFGVDMKISGNKSKWIASVLALSILSGCASYGVVGNTPSTESKTAPRYDLEHWATTGKTDDFILILTFSGGGTRAAAMAYGILQELRDTPIVVDGQKERLLDEVDYISSVSGGSFASAYYGLYGDKIFDKFESEFLRFNVEGKLTKSLLDPLHWFGRKGRTERSIEIYNKLLFHDATFADMMQPGRPMVIINASDLAYGIRFSFIQDYFDFLCSDLASFSVARAVAASSAVPVVFNPVVVENYGGCPEYIWPADIKELTANNREFEELYRGLLTYTEKEQRKYVHFVDGGITDNLGLRAMTDVMAIAGGPEQLLRKTKRKKLPSNVVYITLNASTEKISEMDETLKQPSILHSMNAVTDVQLHRYNSATIDLVENEMKHWAAKMSTPESPITPHFISIDFSQVQQDELKIILNKIPTSFSLSDEQVDTLIKSARDLLRENPKFKSFLAEINQ